LPELPSPPTPPSPGDGTQASVPRGSRRSRKSSPGKERPRYQGTWLSRRRLRIIFPIAAGIVLLVIFGLALLFNAQVSSHNLAKDAVTRMQTASSYNSSGTDSVSGPSIAKQVQEQLSYIAPDTVRSRYLIAASQGTASALFPSAGAGCADQEVIILTGKRYSRCNDAGQSGLGWQTGNADAILFDTLQFKPWQRFGWCANPHMERTEQAASSTAEVFTCEVAVQREADAYWPPDKLDVLPPREKDAREKFLAEGTVDLMVWVRKSDGFIVRFQMRKTSPAANSGVITESLDYTYGDFGLVAPITPPDQGAPTLPGSQPPPSTPQTAVVNGVPFSLEVADTEEERRIGLSNRTSLAQNAGMLFVFPQTANWTFWMKDTLIPLDLLYLDDQGKIIAAYAMKPEPGVAESQLTRYQSPQPAKYGLEINGGLAAALGLQPGMQVDLK